MYKVSYFICSLNEQYRRQKNYLNFQTNIELITHGGIKIDQKVKDIISWPSKDIPTFFYHVQEEEKGLDTSIYNETEVYYTYGIVHKLLIPGVDVSNIGIITPYDAQKKKLREKFNDDKFISL